MCCHPCILIDCATDTAAFQQRPIVMTINTGQKRSLLSRLAGWWRSRCNPQAGESVPVGDAGVNVPKLHTLAGKWPSAVNPLDQRLEQLNAFRDEPGLALACSPLVEGKG